MTSFSFSTTPGVPSPANFGFGATKDTSSSSSGGGGVTGGFGSMNQFGSASKSPKRGKQTMENPLLKNNSSSIIGGNFAGHRSGGGGGITGGGFGGATSFSSTSTAFGRSPLTPMDNYQASSSKAPLTFPLSSTSGSSISFGPPPKASLSLGTGPIIAGLPRPQQSQPKRTVDTSSPPPDPVESPEFSRATANVLTKTMSPPPATATGTFRTMMATTTTTTAIFGTSTTTGNWVVASGYTNRQEYEELKQILLRVGKVVQLKEQASSSQKHSTLAMFTGADDTLYGNSSSVMSGGNWLAVQYESKLAAQEALTNQPFVLHCSGNVCGAFNGMQNGLLQRLTLAAQTTVVTTIRPSLALTTGNGGGKATELLFQTPEKMTEDDLLNLPPRRKSSSGRRNSNSMCDLIVAWLFGWSPEDFEENGDGINPKSD